jgi:signal transduction histidine kinase
MGVTLVPPPATAAHARRAPRVQPGLRLQILLALAGLMVLAFVPLFFAVASLTRATVAGAREETAGVIGRTVAAHVGEALRGPDLARALREDVGQGVDAVCVFRAGQPPVCEGAPADTAAMAAQPPPADSVEAVRGAGGRSLQIAARAGEALVVTRLRAEGGSRGLPLVGLVALYMIVFALALIVFAYFALTRVIVRPVEQLVGAADRVASGARTLRVPRSGARELAELAASVQAMAEKLIAEEANLILKVEELTDTRAQLVRSERMASVGRLAAGLAHEIGNPIAALMGMEDLLLEGGLDADAEMDFLRRMRRETDRIHVVIRDLLDFARPEGRAEDAGPPQPADVAAVVGDVLALVKPQKPFRGVRVESDVAPGLEVTVAASKLTQVLLNLVLNAGGAIAGAGREEGRVVLRARAQGDRVRIEVEDDGPGIAPAVRDRLFEPFVTTKPVGEGTGLGLAVCRGLVESAGGEIGVDPAYEAGARFFVVLPVSPRSTP